MRFLSNLVVLLTCVGAVAAADASITVRNSVTLKALVEAGAQAFTLAHPEVTWAKSEGTTGVGIKALSAGEVNLISAMRLPKDDEKAACPELTSVPFGIDALVMVVNAANPVTNLSKKQVQDLFTGTAASWKDVGGKDEPVVLVARIESYATLEYFEGCFGLEHAVGADGDAKVLGFKLKGAATPAGGKALMPSTNPDALSKLATKPNAVTFASIGTAQALKAKGLAIKMVNLDGIEPTPATISAGTYSLRRNLYLVTKGEAQGAAKDFIAFMVSPEGQKIVAAQDFVPLAK